MSGSKIFLRGCAAPFGLQGRIEEAGGQLEQIEPYAFDLAGGGIDMRVLHDGSPFASTGAATLRLWQNDFGLQFEAEMPSNGGPIWGWLSEMARDRIGASVNFTSREARRAKDSSGNPMDVVSQARIDHVAIVSGPVYADTACWLSTWHRDDLPPRLRAWADRWSAAPSRPGPAVGALTRNAVRNDAHAAGDAVGAGALDHLKVLRGLRHRFDPSASMQLEGYIRANRADPDFQHAMKINIRELEAAAGARP